MQPNLTTGNLHVSAHKFSYLFFSSAIAANSQRYQTLIILINKNSIVVNKIQIFDLAGKIATIVTRLYSSFSPDPSPTLPLEAVSQLVKHADVVSATEALTIQEFR